MAIWLHLERALAPLTAALCLVGPAAYAAGANRADYEATMRCYVANWVASDRLRKRGETARADSYEAKSEAAFNLARQMGRDLGIADPAITRDFSRIESVELPLLRLQDGYFAKAAAVCRARGLM